MSIIYSCLHTFAQEIIFYHIRKIYMLHMKNVIHLISLLVPFFTVVFCIAQKPTNQIIERKIMNDHKNSQVTSSDWINQIRQAIHTPHATLHTQDNQGNPLTLQCEFIDPTSPRLNQAIAQASDMLVQMYTTMELQFAKTHPETVNSEMFLKPIASLFAHGVENVDWKTAETILSSSMHQFLTTTDFAKYGSPNDIQLFVTAYDTKTNKPLGMIQFLVMPQFDHGTIKVAFFVVEPSVHDYGIEQLLLSSIFQLVPNVSRIFLHTRITNETTIKLYQSMGFTQFAGPLPFWIDMEYLTENVEILQQTAHTLRK